MEIQNLNTHSLRNSANMQFHFDVVALIIKYAAARLNITVLFEIYQAAVVRLDEVYKKIVKSKYTEKIKVADKERDTVYSSLKAIVHTAVRHYNKAVMEAAKEVNNVFEAFGNVPRKSYDEQTADITNILQVLKGKYAANIELLRVTEMVAELERANLEFDSLVKARTEEISQQNPDKMKDVRTGADDAYMEIRKRLNAAIVMEGPENYAEFVNELNVTIDRYKMLLAKSHGKKKEDAGDEEIAEAEPEPEE